jgi:predicted nuclease of predicted toxin-antitoxin system
VRFLIDQDVYAITTRLLRELGHDVVTAADLNLSRAPDTELLAEAQRQRRTLVTRDKDYGALVFVERKPSGVILLRMEPSSFSPVHEQLKLVLHTYTEEQIASAFIVVEAGQYRFRRIPNT